jgi:pyrroloquinoline quinone biosynthesis protein D
VTAAKLALDDVAEITRLHRLQWEEAQQSWVLLYPEGMVKLNASAGEILKRVDGARSVAEVIGELERAFPGVDLGRDVIAFLEVAHERGWIRTKAR